MRVRSASRSERTSVIAVGFEEEERLGEDSSVMLVDSTVSEVEMSDSIEGVAAGAEGAMAEEGGVTFLSRDAAVV